MSLKSNIVDWCVFKQISGVEVIIQNLLPVNDWDYLIRSNNKKMLHVIL